MERHQGVLVVGVDFSEAGDKALEAAGRIARQMGLQVLAVHAYQPTAPPVASDSRLGPFDATWDLEQATKATNLHVDGLRAQGLDVTAMAVQGDPSEVIMHLAHQRNAQFVIVGNSHRSAAGRFFLGSVADDVVHHSRRPVMVVPSDK